MTRRSKARAIIQFRDRIDSPQDSGAEENFPWQIWLDSFLTGAMGF